MSAISSKRAVPVLLSSLLLVVPILADAQEVCSSVSPRNTQMLAGAAERDLQLAKILEELVMTCGDVERGPACVEATRSCTRWFADDAQSPHHHNEGHLRSQMGAAFQGQTFTVASSLAPETSHEGGVCERREEWRLAAAERRSAAARHRQVVSEYQRFTQWAEGLRTECVARSAEPPPVKIQVKPTPAPIVVPASAEADRVKAEAALEQERRARAEAEVAERRAREEAERSARAAQEAQRQREHEAAQKAQAEERARAAAAQKADAEASAREEAQRRAEAEARARQEAEQRKYEVRKAEERAEEEAERRDEEAERRAREVEAANERAREEAAKREQATKEAAAAASAAKLAQEREAAKRAEEERKRQAKAQYEREIKEAQQAARQRKEMAQREELQRRAEAEKEARARAEQAVAERRKDRATVARERAEAVERYEEKRARLTSKGDQAGLAELAHSHRVELSAFEKREAEIVERERLDAVAASKRAEEEKVRRAEADKRIAAMGGFKHPRARSGGALGVGLGLGMADSPSVSMGGLALSARGALWFEPPVEGLSSGVELLLNAQGLDASVFGVAPGAQGRRLLSGSSELRVWLSRFAIGAAADLRELGAGATGAGLGSSLRAGPSLGYALVDSYSTRVIFGARWLPLVNGTTSAVTADAELAYGIMFAHLQAGTMPKLNAPEETDLFGAATVGVRFAW